MQEMSEEFNDIVENGNALYYITITRVRDNRILDLPIDNFKYIGVKCADDNITFGNAPCQSVTFSIHNPEINLENEELFIQQGLYLEDGTLENIDLGYFTVQKPISDGEVTQYVCYDRMIKFEKIFYIPGDYPTTYTVNGILYEIEHATGIKINPFPSSVDYRLAKTMWNGIYTMREMLGYLAGIIGRDAIVNRAGEVEFNWYTPVDGYTLDGSRIYQGATNIETEYDMYIEKIVCSVQTYGEKPRELTIGTGNRVVYVSNPFMQTFMMTSIYERIRNFRYRGMTAEFLGDFRLDLGDVINVVKNAVTYPTCIMQIKHQSDGGVRTSIASQSKTESEQDIDVAGPNTRNIDRITEYIKPYGLTINSSSLNLVEGSQNRTVPLATNQDIDNITFDNALINAPYIYSLNEQKIGVWIDGKPLYQKLTYISSLPNNATTNYPHGISDISAIVGMDSYVKLSSGWIANLPWVVFGDDTETITASAGLTSIQVVTNKNRTSMSAYIVLRYTKTTD